MQLGVELSLDLVRLRLQFVEISVDLRSEVHEGVQRALSFFLKLLRKRLVHLSNRKDGFRLLVHHLVVPARVLRLNHLCSEFALSFILC